MEIRDLLLNEDSARVKVNMRDHVFNFALRLSNFESSRVPSRGRGYMLRVSRSGVAHRDTGKLSWWLKVGS